eukprot:jgi/Mesvir1/3908/Mv19851-RA.2
MRAATLIQNVFRARKILRQLALEARRKRAVVVIQRHARGFIARWGPVGMQVREVRRKFWEARGVDMPSLAATRPPSSSASFSSVTSEKFTPDVHGVGGWGFPYLTTWAKASPWRRILVKRPSHIDNEDIANIEEVEEGEHISPAPDVYVPMGFLEAMTGAFVTSASAPVTPRGHANTKIELPATQATAATSVDAPQQVGGPTTTATVPQGPPGDAVARMAAQRLFAMQGGGSAPATPRGTADHYGDPGAQGGGAQGGEEPPASPLAEFKPALGDAPQTCPPKLSVRTAADRSPEREGSTSGDNAGSHMAKPARLEYSGSPGAKRPGRLPGRAPSGDHSRLSQVLTESTTLPAGGAAPGAGLTVSTARSKGGAAEAGERAASGAVPADGMREANGHVPPQSGMSVGRQGGAGEGEGRLSVETGGIAALKLDALLGPRRPMSAEPLSPPPLDELRLKHDVKHDRVSSPRASGIPRPPGHGLHDAHHPAKEKGHGFLSKVTSTIRRQKSVDGSSSPTYKEAAKDNQLIVNRKTSWYL